MTLLELVEPFTPYMAHRVFAKLPDGGLVELEKGDFAKVVPADDGQDYFGPMKISDDQTRTGRGERVIVFDLTD